jgi:hypothetical protein
MHRPVALTVAARRPVPPLAAALALAAGAAALVALLVGPALAQAPAGAAAARPLVTIRELMEKTITPATNTLWNATDPPASEEAWTALEEAAVTLLAAASVNALGGTGPMDNEWVKQPAWQPFNEAMISAANAALKAVRAKDHAALLAAGDILYPPCEGCHLQFNPGVVNQN